jgi:hypothetical protein
MESTLISPRRGLSFFPPEISSDELANSIFQQIFDGPLQIKQIIEQYESTHSMTNIQRAVRKLLEFGVARHKIPKIYRSDPDANVTFKAAADMPLPSSSLE